MRASFLLLFIAGCGNDQARFSSDNESQKIYELNGRQCKVVEKKYDCYTSQGTYTSSAVLTIVGKELEATK